MKKNKLKQEQNIIFVHGWGYDAAFWKPLQDILSNYLNENRFVTLDLGFLGKENLQETRKNGLYITHSLGTAWALKHRSKDMSGLIALSGFMNFQKFYPAQTLETFHASFLKEPKAHMVNFWEECGITPEIYTLNIEALETGIGWLKTWDLEEQTKNMQKPIHVITSENDKVTRLNRMKRHWIGHKIKILKTGGHAGAILNARQYAEKILSIMKNLER